MLSIEAFSGARIFTGDRFIDDQAVLVHDGVISDVRAEVAVPSGAIRRQLDGGMLVPGFVDAQVNGGGGALFNERPDIETIARIALAHARHGTTALLPTLITDEPRKMTAAIDAVRDAISSGVPGVIGIHLEGPFLSEARKGAHDPVLIRTMNDHDLATLVGTGLETLLLTVARESVSQEQIARLVAGGVIVSLGHTNATYRQSLDAAAAGARGVTHLYNAMSPLAHREPGLVGAALECGTLWAGIIADGHHVDPAALRIAIRAKRGPARLFLVTDAMPTAGDTNDQFHLNGRVVTRRNGMLTLDDGTLAGSDLTMDAAVRFAVSALELELAEALRMASLYPAEFLKLDATRGRIAPGFRADLVHLSDALMVKDVWIGGKPVAP